MNSVILLSLAAVFTICEAMQTAPNRLPRKHSHARSHENQRMAGNYVSGIELVGLKPQ
jgi:hypothetical protein